MYVVVTGNTSDLFFELTSLDFTRVALVDIQTDAEGFLFVAADFVIPSLVNNRTIQIVGTSVAHHLPYVGTAFNRQTCHLTLLNENLDTLKTINSVRVVLHFEKSNR